MWFVGRVADIHRLKRKQKLHADCGVTFNFVFEVSRPLEHFSCTQFLREATNAPIPEIHFMAIVPKTKHPQSKGEPVNPSAGSLELASESRPSVTVIHALDHPLTKRFYLDDQGQVQRENYQDAYTFLAENVRIGGIRDLSRVLVGIAGHRDGAVVRGISKNGPQRSTRRVKDQFPEHPDGTYWVMLDIDGEEVPDEMSVVSVEAVRWLIEQKLPPEFRNVNFDMLGTPTTHDFILINPATGNRQLIPSANDVWRVVDVLGGIAKAAIKLGVEEIEVHHWIDSHYVPTRYAERIKQLTGWGIESMQVPPIGTDWPESYSPLH